MNKIKQKNFEKYNELYYNPFEEKSFEVLSKTKIFKRIVNKNRITFHNKKILEIGFGCGNLIPLIIKNGGLYYGIEISKSAIVTCRKKYGNKVDVNFVKSDKIDYNDEYFDILIMSHSLEHIKNENKILKEVTRTLKKNDILIIGVPSIGCRDNGLHFRIYNKKSLLEIFKKHSLKLTYYLEFREILLFYLFMKFFRKNKEYVKFSKNNRRVSLLEKIYYKIISPFFSNLYSMRISYGLISEVWGVFKK